MAQPITSITFLDGIMTVSWANGQQDDWNLAYVVGPVSTIVAPTPTSNVAGEVVFTTRPGIQAASAIFVYPDEETARSLVIDVRDVEDPVYATAQDLADDITANIPVSGGGGSATSVTSTGGPGLSVIETGAGTANVELKRIVAGVGIGVYADTGGLRIENEGALEMIPFVIVTSGDIKAAYRYYDDYNSKPRYVQVIPGTTQAASAAASNFLWWITGDSKWHMWANGGAEYYTSADAVATPDLVTTWVLASGAVAPLPTVDPYYGTQQDLDEVLAARGISGAELRTGSTIAFDVAAVYNSPTSPSSGTVTLDLSGAVAGTEVVAYFNHAAIPTWPSGVTSYGNWNNSAVNVVRFLYVDASNISAVINNGGVWTTVPKLSQTTRGSTTTLAADPVLIVPVDANSKYLIRVLVSLYAPAVADFKMAIAGPAASSIQAGKLTYLWDGASTPTEKYIASYASTQVSLLTSSDLAAVVEMSFYAVTGANAGTIDFQWAQVTSNASLVYVHSGSYMEYKRIA